MSQPSMLVALAQLTSRQDQPTNMAIALSLIEDAAAAGADLVAFPENVPYLGRDIDRLLVAEPLEGPVVQALSDAARKHAITVLAGSVVEAGPDPQHSYNTSLLIGPDGKTVATYRKIHLFDSVVEGATATYEESASVTPGSDIVVAEHGGFTFGLSVCYDLRFPELYRKQRQRGADVLFVPSAFTDLTGRDHWEVLLRARAIENQAYVIAPDQYGEHMRGRRSYGRSMVIDPWGTVIAQVEDGGRFALARLDGDRVRTVRQRMPCLSHARLLDTP